MDKIKGIYKRGKTYWIRYAGLDGRIIFESAKTAKIESAITLLMQKKRAVEEGENPVFKMPAYNLIELADKYSQWMMGRHRSANSKTYRIKQLTEYFGALPLKRFNTLLVEQYQTDLNNKGLKPASVNKNIGVLKAMFSKAVQWEMAPEEILKRVRKVKMLTENNRRLRYLSKEEYQSLVNACDKHLRPIVTTAFNTGMRRGEILSLKWDNIDLKHGFILLDRTKNGERREIPINDTLSATFKGILRRLDIPYVFFDPITGKPYQGVKRSFPTACKRAGIRDFTFHDLRHTFASHLVMAGIELITVKELLGHKTLTMTLRYAHLAPSHKVKAVDILDNTINGKAPTIQKLYNQGFGKESEKHNPLNSLVGGTGIEPVTSAL